MTPIKKIILVLALVLGLTGWLYWSGNGAHFDAQGKGGRTHLSLPTISVRDLPSEARETLKLIEKGGPFPYAKDGVTFHNRERRLPSRRRGYYREYTVKTPGIRGRGPRRIVAGSRGEFYYTGDHYRTFKRIVE